MQVKGVVMSFGIGLLVVFSVMRGTRLVTLDALTDGFWLRRVNNLGKYPRLQRWFTKLVTCQWCASVWVAPVVVVPGYFYGDTAWFVICTMILLASEVTGLVSQWLDSGRREWAGD
jgi:hypothetical protein